LPGGGEGVETAKVHMKSALPDLPGTPVPYIPCSCLLKYTQQRPDLLRWEHSRKMEILAKPTSVDQNVIRIVFSIVKSMHMITRSDIALD